MSDTGMQTGMNQRMAATAAMQLGVRVLQANNMELSRIVSRELEKNPVLELESAEEYVALDGSGEAGEAPAHDDVWEDAGMDGISGAADWSRHDFFFDSLTEHETLAAFLHRQAHVSFLDRRTTEALDVLIDSLDGKGFFDEPPEEIGAREGFSPEETAAALSVLRGMEPNGVGAADIRDCLLIQLEHLNEGGTLACRLLTDCWDDLVRHRYVQAAEKLGVTPDEVSVAVARIAKLNPDPGRQFSEHRHLAVSPDVVVEQGEDGTLETWLASDHIPQLKLSSFYKEALSENYDNAELRQYLKKSFREGRELIQAIAQRQETILNVAKSIVSRQHDYFIKGSKHLKPMGMADVADELGLHVSTISRAVAGKYLLCKWGIKELRSFFTASISASGSGSEDLSSSAVQEMIRELVDRENKAKPLSDAAIAKKLGEKGVSLARRTVAKYREQMKILPASMRKAV